MEFRTFSLDGLLEIVPRAIYDERGYFSEIYRADAFASRFGPIDFVQENQSLSTRPGTIRGVHFQVPPVAQGKLVRCVSGKLFDVAVDLRQNSQTRGEWVGVELTAEKNNQLWIPAGFGHAFCTLSENCVISYRVTNYYSPDHDEGFAWDDPDVAIQWPDVADPSTLSPKDRAQPRLAALAPHFWVEN